ncbi:MAG: ATP12 family chaperone protein [Sphingosinicella sp.]
MKRFYARAEAGPGGAILLDGKPVMTPARQRLEVPSPALAEAIAEEWQGQHEKIDPRAMPLTGLANAAIDRIAPAPAQQAGRLAAYGETDLLCYRAAEPPALVELQAGSWDPILEWAEQRFGVTFERTSGVLHRPQPADTVARLAAAVSGLDPFPLAGLTPLVTISTSLVLGLALLEGAIHVDAAWDAAALDENWQAERWGADPEAARALAARRAEFDAASRFLSLL